MKYINFNGKELSPQNSSNKYLRYTTIVMYSNKFFLLFQRLKNWEQRERKKAREYEKEKEREEERKAEEVRSSLSLCQKLRSGAAQENRFGVTWSNLR